MKGDTTRMRVLLAVDPQRAPVNSHAAQGHGERAVRLVENQYRAVLFDVQERTRVEIDPISAA